MTRTSSGFRVFVCMACLSLGAGCATNLDRANRHFAEARYEDAHRLYLKEYNNQRQAAVLPKWRSRRYAYSFNASYAAAGLLGAAKAADAMGRQEESILFRARLAVFCQRHSLPMDWAAEFDGGRHAPTP